MGDAVDVDDDDDDDMLIPLSYFLLLLGQLLSLPPEIRCVTILLFYRLFFLCSCPYRVLLLLLLLYVHFSAEASKYRPHQQQQQQQPATNSQTAILALPDFLLVKIFEFLPLKALANSSLVCHQWYYVSENYNWQWMVNRTWDVTRGATGTHAFPENVSTWKQCKDVCIYYHTTN
jgi:hypothetical protein